MYLLLYCAKMTTVLLYSYIILYDCIWTTNNVTCYNPDMCICIIIKMNVNNAKGSTIHCMDLVSIKKNSRHNM